MNENLLKLILPAKNSRCPAYGVTGGDGDRAIILPVIILLMAENCDSFLIFALLYILM